VISDIRVRVTFKGHRKRKRLQRILGAGATGHLIDLWVTIATDRPDGILAGWDEIDIADAAGWTGEPVELVEALTTCGFLETENGQFIAHDWKDHQGWVCGAKMRSERARNAARAKWSRSRESTEHAPSMRRACAEHTPSNAPSPSPSPSPKPRSKPLRNSADLRLAGGPVYLTKKGKKLTGRRLESFNRFWQAWGPYKLDKARAADAWLAIPELSDALLETIISAAEAEARRRPEIQATGRTPIYPEGWISGRRWEDETESNAIDWEEAFKRAGI
jgi:hypothetical protein